MHITEGKSFPRYLDFFSGVLPIPPEHHHFSTKKLTPKYSSGYVEISFKNASQTADFFSFKVRMKFQIVRFCQKNCSKCSSESQFQEYQF